MGRKINENKWLALISVTLAYSYSFMVRYIWSPIMIDVGKELGMSATQMGLYMTTFMIGYLVMQIPGGILADHVQPKYALMSFIVIGSLCSGLFSTHHSLGYGLALRAIAGLGLGGIYSTCAKVVTMYFAPKDQAIAMGILLSSPPIGVLLSNVLGEPLKSSLGWRGTLLVVSAIGTVILILLLVTIKKEQMQAKLKKTALLEGAKLYLYDRSMVILGLSGLALMFASNGFTTWMNSFMKTELGYSGLQGGMLLTIFSLAGILATCISGGIVKKFHWDTRRFLIGVMTVSLVCVVLFGLVKIYNGLVAVAIVYGIVTSLPSAHLAALAIKGAPENHTATFAAMENLIFQVGPMLQSFIVGMIVDATGKYGSMWLPFGIASVLAVILMVSFRPSAS